jgi:Aldo/keto reductase family
LVVVASVATDSQLALAWLLAQGDDIVAIPGTRSPKRVEENSAAADLELTDGELDRIKEILAASSIRWGLGSPGGRRLRSIGGGPASSSGARWRCRLTRRERRDGLRRGRDRVAVDDGDVTRTRLDRTSRVTGHTRPVQTRPVTIPGSGRLSVRRTQGASRCTADPAKASASVVDYR